MRNQYHIRPNCGKISTYEKVMRTAITTWKNPSWQFSYPGTKIIKTTVIEGAEGFKKTYSKSELSVNIVGGDVGLSAQATNKLAKNS